MLRFGRTAVAVRIPVPAVTAATIAAGEPLLPASLSAQQRRVLTALCRPCRDADPFATPATNQEIADELVVTVEAIKVHLRALFEKFGVSGLPQNKKRVALVARALHSGLVDRDGG
jgi:DNA-binding NarL/FixJ family response regulator